MVFCDNTHKVFRNYEKEEGVIGSLKSLFYRRYTSNVAVHDFSLEIRPGEIVAAARPQRFGEDHLDEDVYRNYRPLPG